MAARMKGRMTKMNARLLPAWLHIVLARSSVPAGLMRKPLLLIPPFTGKEPNFFDLLTQTETEQLHRNPPALQGQPGTDVVTESWMEHLLSFRPHQYETAITRLCTILKANLINPLRETCLVQDVTLNVYTYITYPWN